MSEHFYNPTEKSYKEAKYIPFTHKYMTVHFLGRVQALSLKVVGLDLFYGPNLVLLHVCVLMFLVPCCDVRFDFRIKTVRFYLQLSRAHVLFTLFVLACV